MRRRLGPDNGQTQCTGPSPARSPAVYWDLGIRTPGVAWRIAKVARWFSVRPFVCVGATIGRYSEFLDLDRTKCSWHRVQLALTRRASPIREDGGQIQMNRGQPTCSL